MKIILLTSNYHLSANIAVKAFLENPRLKKYNIEVAGVVMVSPYSLNGNLFRKMHQFMTRSGWGFSLKNILTHVWKKIVMKASKWIFRLKNREYLDIDELAEMHNIPILKTSNINSKESKKFTKERKPDHLVSCFLLQIIDKEMLAIPKNGSINVHPALIQNHRGTFTSFWTLLKDWRRSGATVHFMTEKPDEGGVILQRHFFVHPSDTLHCVNKKSAKAGARLLVKALIKLKRKRAKGILFRKIGKMFTMPTPKEVEQFYAQGKGLITLKDFFKA